jgi:hypothetical protein
VKWAVAAVHEVGRPLATVEEARMMTDCYA